jgi:hypothetical protein
MANSRTEGGITTKSGRRSLPPERVGVAPTTPPRKSCRTSPTGPLFGLCRKGKFVAVISGDTNNSPARRIIKEIKESDAYTSPSKTIPLNASTLVTTSPLKRRFHKVYNAILEKAETKINATVYQDEPSTEEKKKEEEENESKEEKDENKEEKKSSKPNKINMPNSSTLILDQLAITPDRIKKAKKENRRTSDSVSANIIGEKFKQELNFKEGKFNHGHVVAHCLGTAPVTSKKGDSRNTIPCFSEFNGLHWLAVEGPQRNHIVRTGETLFISGRVTLFTNSEGKPRPLTKSEEITWENTVGHKVMYGLPATQEKPVIQTGIVSKALINELKLKPAEADVAASSIPSSPKQ